MSVTLAADAAGPALPRATTTSDLDVARADLERLGYCVLADALDGAQLAALRTRLDEQAAAEREAQLAYRDGAPDQDWGSFRDVAGELRAGAFEAARGGVNQRVWMLVNKGNEFVDLLAHASLRALLGELLGDEYLLSSFTANIANPGGVPMQLHTDQWWMPAPTRREHRPLPVGSVTRRRFDHDAGHEPSMVAPAACATAMWMLDDFSETNGATRVVPGTHLRGQQPPTGANVEVASLAASAPAGSVMLMDGRLWHGTGANHGNESRRGVLTTFCGPQFRTQENFTLGTRPEVLAELSDDVRALLGFKVWGGYGRIESPVVEYVERDAPGLGRMRPQAS